MSSTAPLLDAVKEMHETTRKELNALWKLNNALQRIIDREESIQEAREIVASYIGNPGNNQRDEDLRRAVELMGSKQDTIDVAKSALETVSTIMAAAAEMFAISDRMVQLIEGVEEGADVDKPEK